jgi:hypothetical protein
MRLILRSVKVFFSAKNAEIKISILRTRPYPSIRLGGSAFHFAGWKLGRGMSRAGKRDAALNIRVM